MKILNCIETIPGLELLDDTQMMLVKGGGKMACVGDCYECMNTAYECTRPVSGDCYCKKVQGPGSGPGCSATDENLPCPD